MSNIKTLGTDGRHDGGFYAVKPDGNLISAKSLPTVKLDDGTRATAPGWRWASQGDVDAAVKAEAGRKAAELKLAKGG